MSVEMLAVGYLSEKLPEKELAARLKVRLSPHGPSSHLTYPLLQPQQLEEFLAGHTQENADEVDNVAAVLKRPFLLQHSSLIVKLYSSLCISEIFRIYAPDPPYESAELSVRRFAAAFGENRTHRFSPIASFHAATLFPFIFAFLLAIQGISPPIL